MKSVDVVREGLIPTHHMRTFFFGQTFHLAAVEFDAVLVIANWIALVRSK